MYRFPSIRVIVMRKIRFLIKKNFVSNNQKENRCFVHRGVVIGRYRVRAMVLVKANFVWSSHLFRMLFDGRSCIGEIMNQFDKNIFEECLSFPYLISESLVLPLSSPKMTVLARKMLSSSFC